MCGYVLWSPVQMCKCDGISYLKVVVILYILWCGLALKKSLINSGRNWGHVCTGVQNGLNAEI